MVGYLDSTDEPLLAYLDEEDELPPEVVNRLRYDASAILEGSVTPAAVAEDWADWFDPSRAFLATYAPEGIEEMEAGVPLMSEEVGEDAVLTEADRVYPPAVELLLDARPEMRRGECSLGGECLVHGVGQVGIGEVQVPRRGGNVGVAHEALDDADVSSAAQKLVA